MSQTVSYSMHLPDVHAHLVEVLIQVDQPDEGVQQLLMPAWSPGSYLLREYARHVQGFEARDQDQAPLSWRKVERGLWEVEIPAQTRSLEVRYRLWAYDLSVRCNYVTDARAFLNGPSTWMQVVGRQQEPCAVHVEAPFAHWKIYTALPTSTVGVTPLHKASFEARSYDHLADCPIEMGDHQELLFQASGASHRLVLVGRHRAPVEQMVVDLPRIIKASKEMFGELPYKRYLTLVMHSDEGRGGLEHRDSTALIFPRHHYTSQHGYEDFLCLFAHEHFHAWNVKRIRPEVLGPFDYHREAYTRALWLMEGTTCYYETLLMQRSGLMSPQRMLELLGERIGEVSQTPGRKVRSLEEASFDAWIKHYRPDASSSNTTISYYLKGEIISWVLDLEIRRRSQGQKSLDDVMLHLWRSYGAPDQGFSEAELESIFAQVTGLDLSDLFARYIRGTADPDYAELLGAFGLKLQPRDHDPEQPYLGLTSRYVGDRIVVDSVKVGSPAQLAGLYAGDELVAMDHQRLDRGTSKALMEGMRPGVEVDLHLFRLGELLQRRVRFGSAPVEKYKLVVDQDAPEQAQALRRAWLKEASDQ